MEMRVVHNFSELGGCSGGGMSAFNPEPVDFCVVENAPIGGVGGTPHIDPMNPVGDSPPNNSQWRKSVEERLGTLKSQVEGIRRDMNQGFNGINTRLDGMSGGQNSLTGQ